MTAPSARAHGRNPFLYDRRKDGPLGSLLSKHARAEGNSVSAVANHAQLHPIDEGENFDSSPANCD